MKFNKYVYLWVDYFRVSISDNPDMDKYEVRRNRLEQLIRERANGSQSQFATMIGRANSYVSRMLYPEGKAGRKRIADDMIEHIETTLGLNRGWFDQPILSKAVTAAWPFKSITYEEVAALNEVELARLETAIILSADKIGLNIGNKSTPDSAAA